MKPDSKLPSLDTTHNPCGFTTNLACLQVPKWIGSKPRLIIVNRKDMVSRADTDAWDKHYAAEAARAATEQAAARQRAAAKAAAKAAAAAGAAGSIPQQQQQHQGQDAADVQQLEQHEELQPPSLPQQVLWTDG